MLLLAVRLRWILWDISQSFVLRIAIITFTVILIYAVAQVNVVRFLFLLHRYVLGHVSTPIFVTFSSIHFAFCFLSSLRAILMCRAKSCTIR